MAQATKIKQDRHGLYVRTGGYIFRPVFPKSHALCRGYETRLKVGDTVKAHHIACTELATIHCTARMVFERWFSHGQYIGVRGTETLWKPQYHCWKEKAKQ